MFWFILFIFLAFVPFLSAQNCSTEQQNAIKTCYLSYLKQYGFDVIPIFNNYDAALDKYRIRGWNGELYICNAGQQLISCIGTNDVCVTVDVFTKISDLTIGDSLSYVNDYLEMRYRCLGDGFTEFKDTYTCMKQMQDCPGNPSTCYDAVPYIQCEEDMAYKLCGAKGRDYICNTLDILEIPISLRWKISKSKLQNKFQGNNRYISSDVFKVDQLPGVKYYLEMQKKMFDDDEECIILGLTIDIQTSKKVQADFKISILSANFSFKASHVFEKNELLGRILCTMDELFDPEMNYIFNDSMIITLKGILSVERSDYISYSSVHSIKSDNLGLILWNRDNKDFAFDVGGKELMVHKLVITAKSEVFERMVESGLKESKENKVTITDFEAEVVEIALKFCYGIEITQLLNVSNAVNLIQFADKYDINDLKISIETFLSSQISAMNVCKISNASILSNSIKLREACFDFILNCNKKSISINNMKMLDKDFAMEIFQASFAFCSS